MMNASISALLQLGVVLLVAAGAWLAARRREPFLVFLGLKSAPLRAVLIALAGAAILALLVTNIPAVRELGTSRGTLVGETARTGVSGEVVAVLALRALIQTSLTEELLFRGLIGRNLVQRWGFSIGNAVQSALFGLFHLILLLVPGISMLVVALIVLLTGIAGWVLGWMNQRLAGGSILPGWAAHGAANLTAYLVLASAG